MIKKLKKLWQKWKQLEAEYVVNKKYCYFRKEVIETGKNQQENANKELVKVKTEM